MGVDLIVDWIHLHLSHCLGYLWSGWVLRYHANITLLQWPRPNQNSLGLQPSNRNGGHVSPGRVDKTNNHTYNCSRKCKPDAPLLLHVNKCCVWVHCSDIRDNHKILRGWSCVLCLGSLVWKRSLPCSLANLLIHLHFHKLVTYYIL